MIWESSNWKEPLIETANYLKRVRLTERTTEKTYVRIEKEVLIGFYSVRKLLDTYKVSDACKKQKYSIDYYKNIKAITYLNWHHVEELYDLSKKNIEIRNIRYICDKFIHSYLFLPVENNSKLDGFYVTTDHIKNKKCYFISTENVVKIFRSVGRDYPAHFSQSYNSDTGEFESSAW